MLVNIATTHNPHDYSRTQTLEMCRVWADLKHELPDRGTLYVFTEPDGGCPGCAYCTHMERLADA